MNLFFLKSHSSTPNPARKSGDQQVVLTREVAIDSAEGNTGSVGHSSHLDGVVTSLCAQEHCGCQNLLASLLLARGPWGTFLTHNQKCDG